MGIKRGKFLSEECLSYLFAAKVAAVGFPAEIHVFKVIKGLDQYIAKTLPEVVGQCVMALVTHPKAVSLISGDFVAESTNYHFVLLSFRPELSSYYVIE
jgi:hypothetical protein